MSVSLVVTMGFGAGGTIAAVVRRGYLAAASPTPTRPPPKRTHKPSARQAAFKPSGG